MSDVYEAEVRLQGLIPTPHGPDELAAHLSEFHASGRVLVRPIHPSAGERAGEVIAEMVVTADDLEGARRYASDLINQALNDIRIGGSTVTVIGVEVGPAAGAAR